MLVPRQGEPVGVCLPVATHVAHKLHFKTAVVTVELIVSESPYVFQ